MISLIIATLNPGPVIETCLRSIAEQTVCRCTYEVVVMDGGSHDGTQQRLDAVNNMTLRYWSRPDLGIGDAWNHALDEVRGDWLLFLGADDVLHDPDVFRRSQERLEALPPQALVCFGRVLLVGGRWNAVVLGDGAWALRFPYRMTVPHQGAFHRRNLFELVGRFDNEYRVALDYELLARPGVRDRIHFMPGLPIASMGQEGISSTNVPRALAEARRVQVQHKLLPRWKAWLAYAFLLMRQQVMRGAV